MKHLIRLLILSSFIIQHSSFAAQRPNVLLILADDLGYGDVQCYNLERGKIPTPQIDWLASQGMRFQRCPKINAEFDQKMAFPATLWLFA
jgi:hypothetical protein